MGDLIQHNNNKTSTQQQKSIHTQASKPIRRTEHMPVNIEHFDTEATSDTTNNAHNVKMLNHIMTNNLCDLQYIDVVLSDETGNCTEVVRAVVDSGAEMCVARKDVIADLDCLTVGTCKLRGVIGDPFDVEVKRAYIGTSNGKKLVPVALACHELVHDALLLTPAVVKCLISNDHIDQSDCSDGVSDQSGYNENAGDEEDQLNGDVDHVDGSVVEPCPELSVSACINCYQILQV